MRRSLNFSPRRLAVIGASPRAPQLPCLLVLGLTLGLAGSASGVEVQGKLVLAPAKAHPSEPLKKRALLLPAESDPVQQPSAVFLEVVSKAGVPEDKGPPPEIHFQGLGFSPQVNACVALTGKLKVVNDSGAPIHVTVGKEQLGPIAPGEGAEFGCGDETGEIELAVPEWPHARGVVYVKSVGIPGQVAPDGSFKLQTQKSGEYKLWVFGVRGPILTTPVDVGRRTVRIGILKDPKLKAE